MRKQQKDCVTLMACSNATGNHELPLVLIGKSANRRCFKNINKNSYLLITVLRRVHV